MKDFSNRQFLSNAAFPNIPNGYFLKAGINGEVQGIEPALPRRQLFTQSTPSAEWTFLHNFGVVPKVVVREFNPLTEDYIDITSSVNIIVDGAEVRVSTENGVLIQGEVDVYLLGFGDNYVDPVSAHEIVLDPHPQYLLIANLQQAVTDLGVSPGNSIVHSHEVVTTATKEVELNTTYIVDISTNVAFTFPTGGFSPAPEIGNFIEIVGGIQGGWNLNLIDGHTLYFNQIFAANSAAILASVESSATVFIKCIKSELGNVVWRVTNAVGNVNLT